MFILIRVNAFVFMKNAHLPPLSIISVWNTVETQQTLLTPTLAFSGFSHHGVEGCAFQHSLREALLALLPLECLLAQSPHTDAISWATTPIPSALPPNQSFDSL